LRTCQRSCKDRRGIEVETLSLQGGFEARSARLLMREGEPSYGTRLAFGGGERP